MVVWRHSRIITLRRQSLPFAYDVRDGERGIDANFVRCPRGRGARKRTRNGMVIFRGRRVAARSRRHLWPLYNGNNLLWWPPVSMTAIPAAAHGILTTILFTQFPCVPCLCTYISSHACTVRGVRAIFSRHWTPRPTDHYGRGRHSGFRVPYIHVHVRRVADAAMADTRSIEN